MSESIKVPKKVDYMYTKLRKKGEDFENKEKPVLLQNSENLNLQDGKKVKNEEIPLNHIGEILGTKLGDKVGILVVGDKLG